MSMGILSQATFLEFYNRVLYIISVESSNAVLYKSIPYDSFEQVLLVSGTSPINTARYNGFVNALCLIRDDHPETICVHYPNTPSRNFQFNMLYPIYDLKVAGRFMAIAQCDRGDLSLYQLRRGMSANNDHQLILKNVSTYDIQEKGDTNGDFFLAYDDSTQPGTVHIYESIWSPSKFTAFSDEIGIIKVAKHGELIATAAKGTSTISLFLWREQNYYRIRELNCDLDWLAARNNNLRFSENGIYLVVSSNSAHVKVFKTGRFKHQGDFNAQGMLGSWKKSLFSAGLGLLPSICTALTTFGSQTVQGVYNDKITDAVLFRTVDGDMKLYIGRVHELRVSKFNETNGKLYLLKTIRKENRSCIFDFKGL